MKAFIKCGFWAGFGLACLIAVAQTVTAQAVLKNAVPGADDKLDKAPQRVTLFFTEKIDPEKSKVEVFAQDSTRVDNGKPFCSENHKNMAVLVKDLSTGKYTVKWEVVVAQGKLNGTYAFQVGKTP